MNDSLQSRERRGDGVVPAFVPLFGELVDEPFADQRRAGTGAGQVKEVGHQVALFLLFERLGYVHHELGRKIGGMLEECTDALKALCYIEKQILKLRDFGSDEMEVDTSARYEVKCEWYEANISRL